MWKIDIFDLVYRYAVATRNHILCKSGLQKAKLHHQHILEKRNNPPIPPDT